MLLRKHSHRHTAIGEAYALKRKELAGGLMNHKNPEDNLQSQGTSGSRKRPAAFHIFWASAALLLFSFVAVRYFEANRQGSNTACLSNLKNIAAALEMYASSNKGLYPPSLAQLGTEYFAAVPLCPCAGKIWEKGRDTYSAGYTTSSDLKVFTLCCKGANHRTIHLPPDYPQYDSITGLIQNIR
jgi:hypothetical protein